MFELASWDGAGGYVLLFHRQCVPNLPSNKRPQTYYVKDYEACNGAKELRLEQLILRSPGEIVLGLRNTYCNVTFWQLLSLLQDIEWPVVLLVACPADFWCHKIWHLIGINRFVLWTCSSTFITCKEQVSVFVAIPIFTFRKFSVLRTNGVRACFEQIVWHFWEMSQNKGSSVLSRVQWLSWTRIKDDKYKKHTWKYAVCPMWLCRKTT